MSFIWGHSHNTDRPLVAIGTSFLALAALMGGAVSSWYTILVLAIGLLLLGWVAGALWSRHNTAKRFQSLNQAFLNQPEHSSQLSSDSPPDIDFIYNQIRRGFEQFEQQLTHTQSLLQGANDRYQLLTDNVAASVVLRDTDGHITFCSPYTEVLTGYSLQEMYSACGDFFLSIIHPRDRETYQRAFKISATGEAFQFRYRILHKTGIEIWVETRTMPIVGDDGEVSVTLSVTLDVTGAVRYQRQVEEKNRDLQDFTYMVSHDLKAPIFTIKGMAAILQEDLSTVLTPDTSDALYHIIQASQRLENLVSSVLEYSRVSSQEIEHAPVPLDQVLNEIREDFSTQIRNVHAELSIDSGLPEVIGDRLRVYQIFSNLIGNALKFRSPERPCKISITLERARDDREISVAVRDNGIGIPEDKREVIFRPFHRLHGSTIEGSGIGLACVRKLLERLNGSISVENAQNGGSIFRVTLERAYKDSLQQSVESRVP